MITNDQQLEKSEQAVTTIKALLRQSRRAMPPEAYGKMARAWLLELQEREREILLYLSALDLPEPATQASTGTR